MGYGFRLRNASGNSISKTVGEEVVQKSRKKSKKV
jgi:hypothetical protein